MKGTIKEILHERWLELLAYILSISAIIISIAK